MTDEPENLTLKLLREMRAEQERLATMLGKVTDAVTQIATTQDHHTEVLTRHSAILEHHSGLLESINEVQASPAQRHRRPPCDHREAHGLGEGLRRSREGDHG
jgi:hypothetical protein